MYTEPYLVNIGSLHTMHTSNQNFKVMVLCHTKIT